MTLLLVNTKFNNIVQPTYTIIVALLHKNLNAVIRNQKLFQSIFSNTCTCTSIVTYYFFNVRVHV